MAMVEAEHQIEQRGDLAVCSCGWSAVVADLHAQEHGLCSQCWGYGTAPYWLDGGQGLCPSCGGDGSSVTEALRMAREP